MIDRSAGVSHVAIENVSYYSFLLGQAILRYFYDPGPTSVYAVSLVLLYTPAKRRDGGLYSP